MINAGDKINIECAETAENGEIVVALVDDPATVKRFYKEKGYYRFQPENDEMAPILDKILFENHDARLLIEDVVSHTQACLYYFNGVEFTMQNAQNIWYRAMRDEEDNRAYSISFLDLTRNSVPELFFRDIIDPTAIQQNENYVVLSFKRRPS